jgi:SAM-dependent methyltransferase
MTAERTLKILDLGCGPNKVKGSLGVDIIPMDGVDVVADFFELTLPFADNTFDQIHLNDVIEHLPNTIKAMEEIYRIARPDAKIFIRVVNWNCIYTAMDPTHLKAFTENSFDFFGSRPGRNYYTKARFEVVRADLIYNGRVEHFIRSRKILRFLSTYLCNILQALDFELRAVKPPAIPATGGVGTEGMPFAHVRCPHCVSGKYRQTNPDPGKLDLYSGKWLICREPGCGRKYPVIEDRPIMINEEAELYREIPREELPELPVDRFATIAND